MTKPIKPKDIAEKLATSSNKKVERIESIRKDQWDDDRSLYADYAGARDILCFGYFYKETRPDDEIEAKYI